MPDIKAGVYYDHPGWYRVSCRYDPWMQNELKNIVGLGNYKYDPKLKMWYVREPYKRATLQLLKKHGYSVEFESFSRDNKQPEEPIRKVKNVWDPIFNKIKDPKLQRKVYRQLTIVLHPDKGGHEELMKDLNEAWSRLTP